MRPVLSLALVACLAGCGEDPPSPAPRAERASEPSEAPSDAPSEAPTLEAARPDAPTPTRAQITERLTGMRAHVREGRRLAGEEDYAGAVAAFQRALEVDDSVGGVHCELGMLAQRAGQPDLARRELLDGVERLRRRPRHPASRRSLGACLYNLGRLEEERHRDRARALYAHSLAVRPNRVVEGRLRELGGPPSPLPELASLLRSELLRSELLRPEAGPAASPWASEPSLARPQPDIDALAAAVRRDICQTRMERYHGMAYVAAQFAPDQCPEPFVRTIGDDAAVVSMNVDYSTVYYFAAARDGRWRGAFALNEPSGAATVREEYDEPRVEAGRGEGGAPFWLVCLDVTEESNDSGFDDEDTADWWMASGTTCHALALTDDGIEELGQVRAACTESQGDDAGGWSAPVSLEGGQIRVGAVEADHPERCASGEPPEPGLYPPDALL